MSNLHKSVRDKRRLKRALENADKHDAEIAEYEKRADIRWRGAQKILTLLSRGTSVRSDMIGLNQFQQRCGF